MLLIKPSPTHMQAQVVTTTIYSAIPPNTHEASDQSSTSVPVPAIVGGVIVGSFIAIVVAVVWVCWGKKIKRDKRRQQEEIEKNRMTRFNTMQNARISGPKSHSYRPLLKRHRDDKRIKFAGDEKAAAALPPADNIDPEKAKQMLFDNPNVPPSPHHSGSISWPLPLIKKLSPNSIPSSSNNTEGSPSHQLEQTSSLLQNTERPASHMPFNVSSHPNASGEPRQGRDPTQLIQAALGNRNSLSGGDRQSSSSLWSQLFRAMPGARRSSQLSNNESYQPSERDTAFPVGTAF